MEYHRIINQQFYLEMLIMLKLETMLMVQLIGAASSTTVSVAHLVTADDDIVNFVDQEHNNWGE